MSERPLSPEAKALVSMSRSALTRRRLLAVAGAGGAAAALAACGAGGGDETSSAAPSPSVTDKSDTDKTLVWSNWPGYLDEDGAGGYKTLAAFEAQTGIKVTYNDDVNDNNEFYAKVRAQLEAGQSIDRDIVVLTDWMAALWIRNGYVQKLDRAVMPNAANLIPRLSDVAFDKPREYSLPWQSGFGAFGWNKAALKAALGTDVLTSVDQLFDPKLKGKVSVLSEMRDTMGILIAWQGNDPSNFTEDQFNQALDALQKQVDSGQIRRVTGNDYMDSLANGDLTALIGWSGDIFQLGEEFGVGLPESGGMLWTDNMLIPASSEHAKNASLLMNYYYQPEVAAELVAYVQYICPVQGAQEAMKKVDPSLVDNQWIFPSAETFAKSYVFMELTPEQDEKYQRQFQKAIGN